MPKFNISTLFTLKYAATDWPSMKVVYLIKISKQNFFVAF